MFKYNKNPGIATPNIIYPTSGVPVDNRVLVDHESDLFENYGTFLIDNIGQKPYDQSFTGDYVDVSIPLYEGMVVAVKDTNKLYMLKSKALYSVISAINADSQKKYYYKALSGNILRPSSIQAQTPSSGDEWVDETLTTHTFNGTSFDDGYGPIGGTNKVVYGIWVEVSGSGTGTVVNNVNNYDLGFVYKGETIGFLDSANTRLIGVKDNVYTAYEASAETDGFMFKMIDGSKSYICVHDDNDEYQWVIFSEDNDLVWNMLNGSKSFEITKTVDQTAPGSLDQNNEYCVAYGLDEQTGIVTKNDWINTNDISGTYDWYHHYTVTIPQDWSSNNSLAGSGDILVAVLVKPNTTASISVGSQSGSCTNDSTEIKLLTAVIKNCVENDQILVTNGKFVAYKSLS